MKYQLQSEHGNISFRPKYFTEAIKILISINVLLFIFRYISIDRYDLAQIFGLSSGDVWPMIWQPVTYIFIHGDFFLGGDCDYINPFFLFHSSHHNPHH